MKYSAATIAAMALLLAGSYSSPACAVEQAGGGAAGDDRTLLRGGGRGMEGEGSKPKRINSRLRSIYGEYMLAGTKALQRDGEDGPVRRAGWRSKGVWKQETGGAAPSKVLVQVMAMGAGAEALLEPAFTAHGFEKTGCAEFSCSGFLPIEEFPSFEARAEVKAVTPSKPRSNQAGSTVSEAVKSLRVDKVREAYPDLTGRGIKIGILANSFNYTQGEDGGMIGNIASGDLPPPSDMIVVKDGEANDEGRAIAQVIHDLVPDAQLFFHTAEKGEESLVKGIEKLANLSCDVIVDDLIYEEPFFQDGLAARAANDVAQKRGVAYFSAIGNYGKASWEGAFVGSGQFYTLDEKKCEIHDFGGGVTRQKVEFGQSLEISFQWDDPWYLLSGSPGASRDMNVRVFDPRTGVFEADFDNNEGLNPLVIYEHTHAEGESGFITLELEFSLCSGSPPERMKWIGFGDIGVIEFDTESPTAHGHPNAEYVAGVGEAYFINTPEFGVSPPELISSSGRGGTPILFDRTGERLTEPEVRNQPRFVATGLCFNTFFGQLWDTYDEEPLPNGLGYYFTGTALQQCHSLSLPKYRVCLTLCPLLLCYISSHHVGTSAAAPNAAAVAAILLQVDPTLTPLEVYDILAKSAIDMATDGYDFDTGAGYIDAVAAVNLVKGIDPEETPAPTEFNNPYDNYNPGEDGSNPYAHLHKPSNGDSSSSSSSSSSDDNDRTLLRGGGDINTTPVEEKGGNRGPSARGLQETPVPTEFNNPYNNYNPGEDAPNPYAHLHQPCLHGGCSSSSSDDHSSSSSSSDDHH